MFICLFFKIQKVNKVIRMELYIYIGIYLFQRKWLKDIIYLFILDFVKEGKSRKGINKSGVLFQYIGFIRNGERKSYFRYIWKIINFVYIYFFMSQRFIILIYFSE